MTRPTPLYARRTFASFACALVLLSGGARAQDGGLPEDVPRILRLPGDNYLMNQLAYAKLDDELKRLQGIERQHKGESWSLVVLVGMGVGLVIGVPVGVLLSNLSQPR